MKLKKGDTVKVLIGKDKGKTGSIERVFPKTRGVLILGVNEFKRHVKSRSRNQKSEILTITKPLPAANVAFVCQKCKKPTRVGYKMTNGKKIRICRKCGKEID
jgi:large subunit ribosomal protein L24